MRVTVIPVVIGALWTVSKKLDKKRSEKLEIRGRIETIQTTALLRSVRILRRVLETWKNSDSSERMPALVDVKNSFSLSL